MTNHIEVSELNQATFQRCPHDPEHPYSMVSNALIRDQSISPECRWLIIYLLSNRQGWKIKISQVVNHVKGQIGRDRVYQIVNEAIEAGYIKRDKIKKGNLEYVVYYISETPKFKKCFRHPEPQDTGAPDTEDPHINNKQDNNNHLKNIVSDPPSSDGLTDFFYEKLKEINPKIRTPNIKAWAKDIHRMQSVDGRTEEEIRAVIEFIVQQHKNPKREFTWSKAVMSAEKLRKHFAAIWLEMNTKTDTQKKEDEASEKLKRLAMNKKWASEIQLKTSNKLAPGTRLIVSDHSVAMENKATKYYAVLGFTENAFKEIVENFIKKNSIF